MADIGQRVYLSEGSSIVCSPSDDGIRAALTLIQAPNSDGSPGGIPVLVNFQKAEINSLIADLTTLSLAQFGP
jgi:hypothetical protein